MNFKSMLILPILLLAGCANQTQEISAEEQAKRLAEINKANQERVIEQKHHVQSQNQLNAEKPVITNCSRFGYQANCTSF